MKPLLDTPICTSAAHLERILVARYPMLVAFETPGCEPCRMLRSPLDELAREFAGRALIVRVEDAALGWLAARYHLLCVPTLLFWDRGIERARIRGNPGPDAIRAYLDFLVAGGARPAPASGPHYTLNAAFERSGSRPSSTEPHHLLAAR